VARTKITIVGKLRLSEEGLLFSLSVGEPGKEKTTWVEALPNAYQWPGLGKFPERPTSQSVREAFPDRHRPGGWYGEEAQEVWRAAKKAAEEEWHRARDAYFQALHSDPAYIQATAEFVERQHREPQPLLDFFWVYRDKVLRLESTEPEGLRNKESDVLLMKHYVLRRERHYERVRREVEALENMETLQDISREPIAEAVRLFVWQRDGGQCVKCGSRERLEFDHIIPLSAGGSNTERNVQLLCESCNRAKGSTI